jgi:hypothetical protein
VFPGYGKELKFTVTTAQPTIGGDLVWLFHPIEGHRFSRAQWGLPSAQPISFGFWVKSSVAGTVSIQCLNVPATVGTNQFVTITTANVAQWITLTVPAQTTGVWDTGNGTGAELRIYLAYSSQTMNIMATVGNTFEITGFVVLPGIEAPTAERSPLIMRPFDQELLTCQRYWRKSYVATVNPGAIDQAGMFNVFKDGLTNVAHTAYGSVVQFTPMRAPPSVTLYSPTTGASGKIRDNIAAADITVGANAGALQVSNTNFLWFGVTGVSTGVNLSMQYTADARL